MFTINLGATARRAFAPLEVPDFRRLVSSNWLWWQTNYMENIAVGWLVLDLTDSAWQVALIGFIRSIPLLLFGFFSGMVTERFGRRKVIVTCQITTLTIYLTVGLLLATGTLAHWHLVITAFILGTSWSMDWPARRALLPDLVGRERTVNAMLLENTAQGAARIIGPALAGVLVGAYGPRGAYLCMAALACISLWNVYHLSRSPIPRTATRPQMSPWTMLAEGLRYVGKSQHILGVILLTATVNFMVMPYLTLLPVFARDILHQGPEGLGFLGAAPGIGGFLGLALIGFMRRRMSNGLILMTGTLTLATSMFVFSRSEWFALSWLMLFAAGVGQAFFSIMQSSIILLAASDEMRGRAMGVVVIAIGADPVGKLNAGALAQNFGAATALSIITGAGALTMLLIGALLPGLRHPITADTGHPPHTSRPHEAAAD
jgi:MFS family permease